MIFVSSRGSSGRSTGVHRATAGEWSTTRELEHAAAQSTRSEGAAPFQRRATTTMEAALRACRMKDLKKRALVFGVTADELDAAEDEDDAKGYLVGVVLAKSAALKALKPRELKKQARALGVDSDDLDDCLDADDPKEAMLLLMLAAAEGGGAALDLAAPPASAGKHLLEAGEEMEDVRTYRCGCAP